MSSIDVGGGLDEPVVVVALAVGEVRDRQAVAVLLVGQGDAVVRLGQEFAQRAERGPVHVVAHVFAQRRAPMTLGGHVFGPGDRQRADGLDGPAALVGLGGVGFVELFAADTSGGGALYIRTSSSKRPAVCGAPCTIR